MAGKKFNFECKSRGSTPRTEFKWFLGSQSLNGSLISAQQGSETEGKKPRSKKLELVSDDDSLCLATLDD